MKFLNLILLISLLVSVIGRKGKGKGARAPVGTHIWNENLTMKQVKIYWKYHKYGNCLDKWFYNGRTYYGCSGNYLFNKWCMTKYESRIYPEYYWKEYYWKYCN